MSNYFHQTRFVSNSDLGALRRVLNLQDATLSGMEAALNFGNLLDARFTEEHKYHAQEKTEADADKAERMYEAGMADSALRLYFEMSSKQHEVYREAFAIEHDGYDIVMPMRCKFDFLIKRLRSGADLKSTACRSKESFVASIFWLHYDRAASLYMDLARLDTFMIIGISKTRNRFTKKHDVYKFAINRGDEVYTAARSKYSRLAFYYYHLIYNLNL